MKLDLQIKTLLCLISIAFSTKAIAQTPQLKNDIRVFGNGVYLDNAWSGGLNNAQVSSIDLNNDGILDIIAFDRADYSVSPFINAGISGTIKYTYAPEYIDSLPGDFTGWVLTYDVDNDGKMDIFTGTQTSNVKVYKNTSGTTGNLSFSTIASPVNSIYNINPLSLYIPVNDVPGIGDIDGDGDVDLLTFDVLGSQVEWHKCLAVDSGFPADSMIFKLQSYCYGHFYEDGATCTAFTNQTPCAAGMKTNPFSEEEWEAIKKTVHAGSTMLVIDLDNDDVQDLLLGDVGCTSVYGLMNTGTPQIANFDSILALFPAYDMSIDIFNFPAMFYEDVDNDGVKDLISAPNQVGGSIDKASTWLYKNLGTNSLPNFSFVQKSFLQDEMIETGTGATPVFFHYDNDSLLDLAIGNQSQYGGGSPTKLAVFRNRGSAAVPEYELVSDDFANISSDASIENLTPTFGDLDGDGDEDLLFGDNDGKIYHYENIALPGAPADLLFVTNNYAGINVGTYSAPHLFDYDADGDLDLVVGNNRGYLTLYENQGTPFVAMYAMVTDTFGMIKINDFTGQTFSNGFAKPFVTNWDNDPALEILVGGIDGYVEIFEMTSTPTDSFAYEGRLLDHDFGAYAAPTAGMIDTMSTSYIVGGQRGGVQLVGEELQIITSAEGPRPEAAFGMDLFPNPATTQIAVVFTGETPVRDGSLHISNALGQRILSAPVRSNGQVIDVQKFAPGIYFMQAETSLGKVSKKFIVQ